MLPSPRTLRLTLNPTFSVTMQLAVRNRGRARRQLDIDAVRQVALADFLLRVGRAKDPQTLLRRLARDQVDLLQELGVLVPVDDEPRTVTPDFALDERCLRWLPPGEHARVEALLGGRLVVNPTMQIQRRARRPAPEHEFPPESEFPTGSPLVWVFDPALENWAAHRPSAAVLRTIERLSAGTSRPESLTIEDRRLLCHAQLLVAPDHVERRRAEGAALLRKARRQLARDGFAHLPQLMQPMQLAQARAYFRALEDEGYLYAAVKQVSGGRLIAKADPLAVFLHQQSARLIRAVTRSRVIPSANFVASYQDRGVLKRHIDREQCAWNVSCLVESAHGDAVERSWPFCVETNGREHSVRLDLGEAVLYAGRRSPHWRDRMGPGQRQTLLLMCYVPWDFVGVMG